MGTVDQHRILCLLKRSDFPGGISLIPLLDVALDLIQISGNAFFCQLVITTLCPCLHAGSQVYLYIRIRKHAGTNIPAIHDHILRTGKAFLQFQQLLSDLGDRRGQGSHLANLFLPKPVRNIPAVQVDLLEALFITDRNLCVF